MGNRARMSREERAKQFMPFAALKGYEEALLEKEKVVVSKIELSEERAEELDQWLHQIKKKDILTVVYFSEDTYLRVTGMVSRLDTDARILKIVNTKISFDDIYDIRVEDTQT